MSPTPASVATVQAFGAALMAADATADEYDAALATLLDTVKADARAEERRLCDEQIARLQRAIAADRALAVREAVEAAVRVARAEERAACAEEHGSKALRALDEAREQGRREGASERADQWATVNAMAARAVGIVR